MSFVPLLFPGYIFPGVQFYGPRSESIEDLPNGFALAPAALIPPVPGTFKATQTQEMFVFQHPSNPELLLAFYCGMDYSQFLDEETFPSPVQRSAVYSATSADNGVTWTNHFELLNSDTTGDIYIRLDCVLERTGVFWLYISDSDGHIHHATSVNGTAITYNPTPVLTKDGQGRVDHPTYIGQLAVIEFEGTFYGLYSRGGLDGYLGATSPDGLVWTKYGNPDPALAFIYTKTINSPDAGGLEFHQLTTYGGKILLCVEGNDGVGTWSCQAAWADHPLGPWTKLGIILAKDAASDFAKAHTATPVLTTVGGSTRLWVQGTNKFEDNGIFGPWSLGVATLNP